MYLVIGILLAFVVSFWKDNRSLWNPVLFLLSLISSYFYLGYLFYQNGYEKIHFAFFIFSFILLPILLFLSGIFLIYNGLILLKREGRSKANYLSMLLGIVILVFFALISFRFYTNHFLNILFAFIAYSYFIFGFAFVGFMLYSILYLFIPKKKHYDFIIIHGAGLLDGEKVTPLLKRRIDKAVEAYHKSKNPRIKIIASGGQGGDEKISEAQAICNYLLEETDVPREAILLEEDSTTTYENLLFSKEMGERLVTSPRFLFVTNDYHVFRTSTYARRIGMKGDGLGCRTAAYYIPSAFIREYIALCVKMRWLFITLYVLLILALIFSYRGVLW